MRYVPLRALTLAELASSVLQRNGPWHGDELAPRRLVVALLLSAGAAASAPPSIRGTVGRGATSAPPSPSRHDPWRLLRCVWIRVIAIARIQR